MSRIINWMGGWPKEGLIGAGEWEERTERFAEMNKQEEADEQAQGLGALRERIAEEAARSAAEGDPSRVFIAQGADAAIEWLARSLLRAQDVVLVERPTSRSALQLFNRLGAIPVSVPGDRDGMDPEALSHALKQYRPKLVYAAVACTDPEGRGWSGERRLALAERCRDAGVMLLRDDRQALLLPGRRGADPEAEAGAAFCSVGELPPGLVADLRLGWLACRGIGDERLRMLTSRGGPAQVALRDQRAAADLVLPETLEPLLATQRFVCRARIGLLLEQLKLKLNKWPSLSWTEPQEGMHVWVSLPEGLDGDVLLRAAWMHGLLFQPGSAFYADEPDRCKLRITAVHTEEKQIRTGVKLFEASVNEMLARLG